MRRFVGDAVSLFAPMPTTGKCYMQKTAEDWVRQLGLGKHPEGGYYRETYRSGDFEMGDTMIRDCLWLRQCIWEQDVWPAITEEWR